MAVAYAAERWTDFGVATAGAAAALLGLLIVAVSINLQRILQFPHLPHRAAQTLILLALPLTSALLLIVPGQPDAALGGEYLVIGLATGAYLLVTDLRIPITENENRRTWLMGRLVPDAVTGGCLAVAGVTLLAQGGGGLYWLVPSVLAAFFFGLLNAWVLLVEILR